MATREHSNARGYRMRVHSTSNAASRNREQDAGVSCNADGLSFFRVSTGFLYVCIPFNSFLMALLSCGVPRLFLFCAHTCMYMSLCIAPMPASMVPRPAFAMSFARDVFHAASGCRVLARIMSWTLWSAATAFTEPANFHRQLPWSSHHIQHGFEQPGGYPHTCPFSSLT